MSLPEVVWVAAAVFGTCIAWRAYYRARAPRVRLKHSVRAWASMVFLFNGIVAAFTPPPLNPNWLTVITPMAIAFGVFCLSLLSVIDEQEVEDVPRAAPK